MEQKEYMQRLDLLGRTGIAVMGLGAAAICAAISIDFANYVQISEIDPVIPPDSAYTELWVGGAGGVLLGQQILAFGYRRDKCQSDGS